MSKGAKIALVVFIIVLVAFISYLLYKHLKRPKLADLPYLNKVKGDKAAFGNKVIQISEKLGISPIALMLVMNNESGLNPKAVNPYSKATGLIQFLPSTAKGLGTSVEALQNMSATDQLDYVYLYLKKYASKIHNFSDVYLSVFFPAALYYNDSYQFPQWAVNANKIFDINKDGLLTKAEFRQYFRNKYPEYF